MKLQSKNALISIAAFAIAGVSASAAQACWTNVKVVNQTGEQMEVNHFGTKKKGKNAWLRISAKSSNAKRSLCWTKAGETCVVTALTARTHGTEFKTRVVYRLKRKNKRGSYKKKTKARIAESGYGTCRPKSDHTFHEGNRTHVIVINRKW